MASEQEPSEQEPSEQEPSKPAPRAVPYAESLPSWLLVGEIYQKGQRALLRGLRPLDLSIAQHDVLTGIKTNPGLTQRELADVLYVVKSNVTGLVQKLEQRGLVTREQDSHDARSNCLSLTPDGEELVRRSLRVQRRVVSVMMGPLTRDDMAMLTRVMQRVGGALDDLAEQDG